MFRAHLKRVLIGGLAGLLLALALALFLLPKVYEGTTELQVGINMQLAQFSRYNSTLSADLERIITEGEGGDAISETQVLASEALLTQALQNVAQRESKPELLTDADSYYNMYDVTNPKESQIAIIRVRAYDPQTAADIANEVGTVYGALRTSRARDAVTKALDYLNGAATRAKDALTDVDKRITAYRKENRLTDVNIAGTQSAGYISTVRQQLDSASSQYGDAQGQVAALQAQIGGVDKEIVSSNAVQKRSTVQQLESNETDLLRQRSDLAVIYSDRSPSIVSIDQQLKGVRARLAAERKLGLETASKVTAPNPIYIGLRQQLTTAQAARDGAQKRVASLKASLADAEADNQRIGAAQAGLESLNRDRTIAEQQNATTQLQLKDLQTRSNQIRSPGVLYAAVPSPLVVAPNPVRYALVGLIGGVALALVFSLSVESLRLRVYTSSQLTELTGLPVLATMPVLKMPERRRVIESMAKGKPRVLEPFRYMALAGLTEGRAVRSVLFTGVGTNTGATTAALQYAVAASEAGQSVVLVDFNHKNPTITRIMNMTANTGVVNILNRSLLPAPDISLSQPTSHERLKVLPIGSASDAHGWDLSSATIQGLIEMLSKEADLVVIDCAPSDVVSDAAAISSHVDRVALVVSASETAFKYVPAAYEILKRAGAKDVGLVLSDANPTEESFLLRGRYAA